jgi:hypothetical protein
LLFQDQSYFQRFAIAEFNTFSISFAALVGVNLSVAIASAAFFHESSRLQDVIYEVKRGLYEQLL